MCKYRKFLRGLNLFTFLLWPLSQALEIVYPMANLCDDSPAFAIVRYWLGRAIFLMFILVLMRLKTLEIYMNPWNDTEDKIAAGMGFFRIVFICYISIYCVYVGATFYLDML